MVTPDVGGGDRTPARRPEGALDDVAVQPVFGSDVRVSDQEIVYLLFRASPVIDAVCDSA